MPIKPPTNSPGKLQATLPKLLNPRVHWPICTAGPLMLQAPCPLPVPSICANSGKRCASGDLLEFRIAAFIEVISRAVSIGRMAPYNSRLGAVLQQHFSGEYIMRSAISICVGLFILCCIFSPPPGRTISTSWGATPCRKTAYRRESLSVLSRYRAKSFPTLATLTGFTCRPNIDPAKPASLMVFNDGHAFLNTEGSAQSH